VDVRMHHHAVVAVETAILVQRIRDALQNADVDLAFELQHVHRPAAIVHGDHVLDLDDPGLGVHPHLNELHAAEEHAFARDVVRTALRSGADHLDRQPGRQLLQTQRNRVCTPERRLHVREQLLLCLIRGIPDSRSDRGRRHAAARWRPWRRYRVTDRDLDIPWLDPEFLRNHLCDHCLDAAADVLNGRERFHRAVAIDADLDAGVHVDDAIPDGLRNTHTTFDRTWIAVRPAELLLPSELLRADPPLLATRGTLVVQVSNNKRIHAEFLGQLVHRLLESETAWRMSRRAEGSTRTRVGDHVILFPLQVVAFVPRVRRARGARGGAHT